MINLEKISGLPIELTDDYHLKFNSPLKEIEPSVRKFSDMLPVLMDPSAKPDPERDEMYYMYRDIVLPHHRDKLKELDLRYDITVIPPGMIGKEFNKTLGHYHPMIPGQKLAYPEIYEVLHGKGLFLLQKMDEQYEQVVSVRFIEGKTGHKIIYPPNYGHIIANIGPEPLVTANWVVGSFQSLYEPVKHYHGLAYYAVKSKEKGYDLQPNPAYRAVPQAQKLNMAAMANFPIAGPEPMYQSGVLYPQRLEFLKNPQKYAMELSSITS